MPATVTNLIVTCITKRTRYNYVSMNIHTGGARKGVTDLFISPSVHVRMLPGARAPGHVCQPFPPVLYCQMCRYLLISYFPPREKGSKVFTAHNTMAFWNVLMSKPFNPSCLYNVGVHWLPAKSSRLTPVLWVPQTQI